MTNVIDLNIFDSHLSLVSTTRECCPSESWSNKDVLRECITDKLILLLG